MRKFLVCLSLALASAAPALADTADKNAEAAPERDYYIEVSGTQRGISPNIIVKINPGKLLPTSLGIGEEELSASLRSLQFPSMADALNYLADRGWSVATSYTVSTAGNTTICVLMRQTTADPGEIARTFITPKK